MSGGPSVARASSMIRFAHFAVVAAAAVFVAACSDHDAELKAARGSRDGGPNTGIPSIPAVGAGTLLPGNRQPGGAPPPQAGGATCQPQQVAQVQATWRPPSQPRPACTQQEALAVVDCAFSTQNCNIPSADCKQCAVSLKSTAQSFGPLIVDDTTEQGGLELNVEGCAALLSQDIGSTGCGPRLQAMYLCEEPACAQCESDDEKVACMEAADQGPCAQYAAQAEPCGQYAQSCLQGSNEQDVAFSLLGLFCGK